MGVVWANKTDRLAKRDIKNIQLLGDAMKLFFLSVFILLFTACSSLPKVERTSTPTIMQAEETQKLGICDSQALPSDNKELKKWKYGCFCGLGHPPADLRTKDDYYSYKKPKDHIDLLCRDHDVCWAEHGDGDRKCNEEFRERMDYLKDKFSFSWGKDKNERCEMIAGEISLVFRSVFITKDAAGIVTLPLDGIAAGLKKLRLTMVGYPGREEKCLVSDFEDQYFNFKN